MQTLREFAIHNLQQLGLSIVLALVEVRIGAEQRFLVLRRQRFCQGRALGHESQLPAQTFQLIEFGLAELLAYTVEHAINLRDRPIVRQTLHIGRHSELAIGSKH